MWTSREDPKLNISKDNLLISSSPLSLHPANLPHSSASVVVPINGNSLFALSQDSNLGVILDPTGPTSHIQCMHTSVLSKYCISVPASYQPHLQHLTLGNMPLTWTILNAS